MARLNELELKLLGDLLEEAIDQLSNNGCNDLPIEVTDENKAQVRRLIRATTDEDDSWRKDLLDDAVVGGTVYLNDYVVLGYFRDRIIGK